MSKFIDDQWYVMDGETMQLLWQHTVTLLADDLLTEEQDEAVRDMQKHLERASRLAKKIARVPAAHRRNPS